MVDLVVIFFFLFLVVFAFIFIFLIVSLHIGFSTFLKVLHNACKSPFPLDQLKDLVHVLFLFFLFLEQLDLAQRVLCV